MFKHNMYKLREERDMKPATFSQMVSSTLYEKRCAAACPAQAVHRATCQACPLLSHHKVQAAAAVPGLSSIRLRVDTTCLPSTDVLCRALCLL